MEDEPIQPLQPVVQPPEWVALGRRLFLDPRLSRNDSVSCAHCHLLEQGGDDGLPRSVGIEGRQGFVNSPTVFNLSAHVAYFWNGRAESLEALILHGPLQNRHEMDSSWPQVLDKLGRDPSIRNAFQRLFPEGLTANNVARVIAAFLRSLVTLDAPFDRWLKGDSSALTPAQLRGYRLFKSYGCIACHQGRAVGGNMFAPLGVLGDYFADRGTPIETADLGRMAVTGREEDRHVFKLPSLRLVIYTAPYFHDGRVPTLEQAIRLMGRYQLGREIPSQDVADLIAFLTSLAGHHPLLKGGTP